MQVDVRDEGGVVFIEPAGDIDGKRRRNSRTRCSASCSPVPHRCQFERVAFMSSAGLRLLLRIYRDAKSKAAKVVLTKVNTNIRDSMSATGFLSFFVLRDSVQDDIWEKG